MDPQIETALARQGGMELADDRAHAAEPGEQWLSPVQDNLNVVYVVVGSVVCDAPGSLSNHLVRHRHGLRAPTLIRALVHIAMVAGQIATAMNLYDELLDRNQ